MSVAEYLEIDAPTAAARRRGPLRPAALAPSRRRIEGSLIVRLFTALDRAMILAGLVLAIASRGDPLAQPLAAVAPIGIGALVLHLLLSGAPIYGFASAETRTVHLVKIGTVGAVATLGAGLTALVFGQPVRAAITASLALSLVMVAAHLAWLLIVARWREAGRLTPNVVVVGATPNAQRLIEAAIASRDVAILGVFDDRAARSPEAVGGVPVLGDTNALLSHPLLPYVDRIVITVPPSAQARVRSLIDRLRVLPNAVTLFMDLEGEEARAATVSRLARTTTAHVCGARADEKRAFDKRVQDIVLGGAALIVALPLMAVIALLVKLDSPGPALFRQRRHGFNNEAITVWKFRSMRVEAADYTASRQVSHNDDRVTRIGRVIRKLSLDELPQLINVVRGEMSLVGPRPHAIGMKTAGEESAQLVAEYAWRHRMKPGITGWAQINGSIGAVDTPEGVRRRVALDVEYIENQSLWLDLYIVLMTLPALILARNVVR